MAEVRTVGGWRLDHNGWVFRWSGGRFENEGLDQLLWWLTRTVWGWK